MKKVSLILASATAAVLLSLGVATSAQAVGTLRQPPSCIPQTQQYFNSAGEEWTWTYKGAFFSAGKAGYTYYYAHWVPGQGNVDYGNVNCTV